MSISPRDGVDVARTQPQSPFWPRVRIVAPWIPPECIDMARHEFIERVPRVRYLGASRKVVPGRIFDDGRVDEGSA
jgi:hypothetical protein